MAKKQTKKIKIIQKSKFKREKYRDSYDYQTELTAVLDNNTDNFNQDILNQIVLWKVNRFVRFKEQTIAQLNQIDIKKLEMDKELTTTILQSLLKTKGVQLPMASAILRFRNPKIYQIIDKRVFRIVNGKKLKLNSDHENEAKIKDDIVLYFKYLKDLKKLSDELTFDFEEADRILYQADKDVNKGLKI